MRKMLTFIFLAALWIPAVHSQNLMNERIRKVGDKKRNIYFDDGVFHNGGPKKSGNLKAIRHSYKEKDGYERLVFDFKDPEIPRVYSFLNKKKQKLYLDFYSTELDPKIGSFGNAKFVKDIQFFPIDKEMLSVEVNFKDPVLVEIFYLANPGRLVIDVKK